MALKRAGYAVCGWNRSQKPLDYALSRGIIDYAARDFKDFDVVFVALPPEAVLDFINGNTFRDGAVVSDICGVKKYIADGVYARPRNFLYVGTHPMAGKEVSGVENACGDLFDSASMVITVDGRTDASALQTVRNLTREMGFARIVECSPDVHDRKIAYTSQLAHIVSNAYVKDGEIDGCIGFTGGSFQDMTRIAGVDENVWASLYLRNSDYISEKVGNLISSLQEIKDAIDGGDFSVLCGVLREGRLRFTDGKKNSPPDYISVKILK